MLRSPEAFLHLLQRSVRSLIEVKRVHCSLISSGQLLPTSNISSYKWMTTLLYNALIRSYLDLQRPRTVVGCYRNMVTDGVPANNFTFPSVIKAATSCALEDAVMGRVVHSHVVRRGLEREVFVGTALVGVYSQCGDLVSARQVFEEITDRGLVCCNAMLDAFGKNGEMSGAFELFEVMQERDVVSWTSVISGFGRNGLFEDGVVIFRRMMVDVDVVSRVVRPNEATLVNVLSCCANSGGGHGLRLGKQLHGFIVRNEIKMTAFLATGLIALYGRMGCLQMAIKVFSNMAHKAVCVWNAMISALACNGQEENALDMFKRMKFEGHKPDEVTFIAVITACAHFKFVGLGLYLFDSMTRDWGIDPTMEHFGCVVDLLGRAGLLKEASDVIETMPFKPDTTVLGALLGACKVHGAIELADEIARKILDLKPQYCDRYVTISSISAEAGRWTYAADLRKAIAEAGIKKITAYSSVGYV